MDIEFADGAQYRYFDVPPTVYDDFIASQSKAKFFSSNIQGNYPHQRRGLSAGGMDLPDIISAAVTRLPKGSHEPGLRSVINHIEQAVRHFQRGQQLGQQEWFTDTVYRCNQAFEGSVKEAYRVLARGDPSKKTPYEIEGYLEENKTLRPKVLIQLTRYRQEWRNPATHDHNLDFDENEAFLAIVNVAAFSKVLVDQIAVKLAFDASSLGELPASSAESQRLIDLVASQISDYLSFVGTLEVQGGIPVAESHMLGSIAGYLQALENSSTQIEPVGAWEGIGVRPDLVVQRQREQVLVEIKRNRPGRRLEISSKVQLLELMSLGDTQFGCLVLFDEQVAKYTVEREAYGDGREIRIVRPTASDAPPEHN